MRIGVHTGHIHSGVIGLKKWQFDVWSNDVSIAMHCESSGIAGRVHCTAATINSINDSFDYEDGDGPSRDPFLARLDIQTYLIIGAKNSQQQQSPSTLNGHTSNKSTIISSSQPQQDKENDFVLNQGRRKSTASNRIDRIQHQQPDYSRPFSSIDHTSVENIRVATMSTINQTLISTNRTYCFENHHDLNAITLTFRDDCLERLYARRKVHKLFYFLALAILISMFIMPIVESLLIGYDSSRIILFSAILTLAVSASIAIITVLLDREKCNCDSESLEQQKYQPTSGKKHNNEATDHDDPNTLLASRPLTPSSIPVSTTQTLAAHTEIEQNGRRIGQVKQSDMIPEQHPTTAIKFNDCTHQRPALIAMTTTAEQPTYLDQQQSSDLPQPVQFISIVTVNNPTTGLNVKTSLVSDTLLTMRKKITRSKPFKLLHFHISKSITVFKTVSIVIILTAVAILNISRIDLSLDIVDIDENPNHNDISAANSLLSTRSNNTAQSLNATISKKKTKDLSVDFNLNEINNATNGSGRTDLNHHIQLDHPVSDSLNLPESTIPMVTSLHNGIDGAQKELAKDKIMNRSQIHNQTKYKELTIILMILTIDALNPLSFPIKLALIFIYFVTMTLVPAITFFVRHTTNATTTEMATRNKLNTPFLEIIFISLCSLSGSHPNSSNGRDHLESSYHARLGLSLSCLIIIFSIWILLFKRQFEYISRTNFLWRQRLSVDQEELEYISGINKVLLENILPSHVVQYYLELPKSCVMHQTTSKYCNN